MLSLLKTFEDLKPLTFCQASNSIKLQNHYYCHIGQTQAA